MRRRGGGVLVTTYGLRLSVIELAEVDVLYVQGKKFFRVTTICLLPILR